MSNNSIMTKGQLSTKCLNPSIFITAGSTFRVAINSMQTSLRSLQWCCSAKTNVVAISTSMPTQSLLSQSSFSLSSPYLSAATSRCWNFAIPPHLQWSSSSKESVYTNWRSASKIDGSMSSIFWWLLSPSLGHIVRPWKPETVQPTSICVHWTGGQTR